MPVFSVWTGLISLSKSPSKRHGSKPKPPRSSGKMRQSSPGLTDVPCQNSVAESVDINEYPELDDILYDSQPQETQIADDILSWIERIYKSSRGFELGTFDPAILPWLFKQQTIHWEHLAMTYISDVILHIHRFCNQLLDGLCTEERVRDSLWAVLIEEILLIYKRAIAHVAFILRTEREGNLITTNHYFSENLEKARATRLEAEDEVLQITTPPFEFSNPTDMSKTNHIERVAGISNLKHTVQDIHDILKSYYTVARKRFVDNVCMQAMDYHLVSGPEMPLKVLSPTFVGNLTSDQLEAIAGEDSASIQLRKELHKEIESLRDGKMVLAS